MAKRAKRGNPNMLPGAPSVNPSGKARTDAVYNEYTGHGTSDDPSSFTRHYTRPVSEREAIDLRRGNWLARRILEDLPNDCFRRGYTLKLPDKEQSEAVMTRAEELCINAKLAEAGATENTVGGAALFPVLDGAIGDLSEPLDLDDNPRIIAVRAVHLLESRELIPLSWYGDINSPKFRQPETYRLHSLSAGHGGTIGAVIHESRLAIFHGKRVSVEMQPGQPWGWGDSKLTPVLDVIHNFGLSWGSAAAVLRNFSERVIKVKDLMEILAKKGGRAALEERMRFADKFRSTLRGQLFDADDTIETLIDSIAGMPDLLLQLAQIVSAAAEEPMTRLFGMSPSGMNATGESDTAGWHERVSSEQVHKYTSPAEWLLRLIMLSTDGPLNGNEPDMWSLEWKPLKHPSELEVAQTRKLVAETDEKYADMGMPAERILEDRFGGDTYSMETTFNIAEFKKQQAENEKMRAEIAAADAAAAQSADDPDDPDATPKVRVGAGE
jgi:phage-related protein (TIGR01555 family)